jgi:general secretion pathway protein D
MAGLLAGCQQDEQVASMTPPCGSKKILVDTYPPPVDPVTQPRRPVGPPVPPKIIEGVTKSTLIYTCRYTQCEILREAAENFISPEGTIQASPQLNTLLLSDAKELVPGLLRMIQELDVPTPQILVEARVIEVNLDSDFEYEIAHVFTGAHPSDVIQNGDITLDTPGATPNPDLGSRINIRPFLSNGRKLDDFIRLLLTNGKAKILSSPNLIVGAGTEASIITGQEVPIQSATVVSGSVNTTTVFKRVGIKLRVVPLQISGDHVKVEINPEVSTVTGYTAAGASGVSNPIVAIRNVRSTLSVKDGEVVTIGGLLQSEDHEVTRKVPCLGDIPLLGLLFQSKRIQSNKSQLVFFLRINILGEVQPQTIRLHQPGGYLEDLDDFVSRMLPGFVKKPPANRRLRGPSAQPDDAAWSQTQPAEIIYTQPEPPTPEPQPTILPPATMPASRPAAGPAAAPPAAPADAQPSTPQPMIIVP